MLIFATFALLPIERIAVLELGGFTLRPVYILMGIILLIWPLKTRLRSKYTTIGIVIATVVMMSSAFSLFPEKSLPYAGWALFTIAFSIVFASRLSGAPKLYDQAIEAYLYTATLWSLVAIAQWLLAFKNPQLAYSFVGMIPRVQTLTLEPSYLATYLLPPLFIALFRERRTASASIMLALLTSTSRTGVVALSLGMMVFIIIKYKHIFSRARKHLLSMAVVSLILVYPIMYARPYMQTLGTFLTSGFLLTDQTSAVPRLQSWKEAFTVFAMRPWLGVGVGVYGNAVLQFGIGNLEEQHAKEHKTTNLYAEVAAEMGLAGVVVFFIWIICPIISRWRDSVYKSGFGLLVGYLMLIVTFPFIQTWWRPYIWIPWVLVVSYGHRR